MNLPIDIGGVSLYNFRASIFQETMFLSATVYMSRGQQRRSANDE